MTRLCRRVNEQRRSKLLEQRNHSNAVTYIELVVMKSLVERHKPALIPSRVALRTEEIGAHIVIDPVDVPAKTTEIVNHFRTD